MSVTCRCWFERLLVVHAERTDTNLNSVVADGNAFTPLTPEEFLHKTWELQDYIPWRMNLAKDAGLISAGTYDYVTSKLTDLVLHSGHVKRRHVLIHVAHQNVQ